MNQAKNKPRKPSTSRWVHMRFTGAGWMVLGLAILAGAGAVHSRMTLMYLLFGGLMGAVTISILLSHWMVRSVDIRRDLPGRTWQHQAVTLDYALKNVRGTPCLGICLAEADVRGADIPDAFCLHLPTAGTLKTRAVFTPLSRGRLTFHAMRVSTAFPFGLATAGRTFPRESSLVVWPSRGKLLGPLLHRGAEVSSNASPGATQGGQDEFFGLREYRPGDSPRWIHWRRSAGRAAPVVREMSQPLPDMLFVVLDTQANSPVAGEVREKMLRFAATLIDYAFHHEYQVGIALANHNRVILHSPGGEENHRVALLDALADVGENTSLTIGQTALGVPRGMIRQAQVIVLTCGNLFQGDGASHLARFSRHVTVLTPDNLGRYFQDCPQAKEARL